jgi:MYXO-CTERM domain-containing protein
VDPLRYCDYTQSPRRCVQCTQDAHCPMPLVCANTTSRTCVECTPAKLANCSPDRTGAACLPSNTCGCTMDSHCGGTMSGRVCETVGQRCQVGCRAVGGNGCPAGQICTSTTNAIGLCVPAPIVVVTDAGAVSDAAPRDAAAGRDAGGPGDVPQALPDAAPDLRIADAAARDIATDAVAGARPDAIEAGGVDAVREAGVAEAGAPRDGAAEAGTAPADVPRAVALDTGMATSAVDSGQEPLLPPPVTDDGSFIAGGGCGCRVGDAGGGIGAPAFGLLALGGVLLLRRRSRRRP